jgi:addiction module HigA family antidote
VLRKLDQLNAAAGLADLAVPPGNKLELLRGSRKGQHSIRINDQWRICFVWMPDGAHRVEIVDYHWDAEELDMAMKLIRRPVAGWAIEGVTTHPGAVLREDFLGPLGISAHQLALRTRMPATRVGEILHERRAVSPDTALRLARFLGTSAEFWLNLQAAHDLSKVRCEAGKAIQREIEPLEAEALSA